MYIKFDEIIMRRRFLSVGQGAFYVEQFLDPRMNIIYDCGTKTSTVDITNEIKNVFKKDEVIDAIFISHFDNDHISGLEFLLYHCNVKHIFIPYVTKKIKLYFKLNSIIFKFQYSSFFNSLIFENKININNKENPVLHFIMPTNMEAEYNDIRIKSNTDLNILFEKYCHYWHFIPYNYDDDVEFEKFKDKFEKIFGKEYVSCNDIDDLLNENNEIKDNIEKLRDIYENIGKNLNSTSMSLLSYSEYFTQYKIEKFNSQINNINNEKKILPCGCLYTGDYEGKMDFLINNYSIYRNYIGVLQIPHHGSKKNYDSKLLLDNVFYCVISAGVDNQHNHPHFKTVYDIFKNGRFPLIVTENKDDEVEFVIR